MSRTDPDSGAVERHLAVERTARYWLLGPDPDEGGTPSELWIVLHGYRQLARRFVRRFTPIDDGHRLIVAPEALSRFYVSAEEGRHGVASVVGATWMTREDRLHEIADYVGYLDRLHARLTVETGPLPLTVLGFSQGVATASRWAVQGTVRPDRLVLWGDFSPPDLDLTAAVTRLDGVDVVTVRGRRDRALSPDLAEQERQRLDAAGVVRRSLEYDGGHDIDPEALRALAAEPPV